MPKERVTISLDKETVDNMRKRKEKTGMSISQQVELKIKGYQLPEKTEG